ncbi:MAG: tetratricopeptide repeat protein [Gammaproteobacteria bacterium]|nr:tetratricopeptide repeat protein [Gammaproteobacteria bacterium]
MALQAAEEETIETLKQWWRENGKQLVLLFIVVFASYTGWLLWQNSRLDQAEAASDLYEEIMQLAVSEQGSDVSDADSARIIEAAALLQTNHSSSVYAMYGALFAAQQHVRNDDLGAAETALQWILDNRKEGMFSATEPGLLLTAELRLGRVLLAQGEAERALTLVNGVDPKSFEPAFAELRGDIYIALERVDDAREAYLAAQQAGSNSEALRMKLDALGNKS